MRRRAVIIFALLALLLLFMLLLSVALGSVHIPMREVADLLLGTGVADPRHERIIMDVRLPKTLTALLAGAALSVSGLLMQTLFRNPLAGPYVLGISSGSVLGVALMMLTTSGLGLAFSEAFGGLAQVAASCAGAMLVMVLILAIARRVAGNVTLLIIGLMVGYVTGSMVDMLIYFSSAEQVQSFALWSMGSFGHVTWNRLSVFAPAVAVGLILSMLLVRDLDVLLLGDKYAVSVGMPLRGVRALVILATCLLAGAVTAFCGPVAFIGIAVPHIARRLFRQARHLVLLPGCMLAGATLTLLSDIIARMPGSEKTLPLNSVTALIGAPIVIWVILRGGRHAGE